jgi:hypothetical protein
VRTFLCLLLAAPAAFAQNIVLQHHGRLLDQADQPQTGTHTLTFKIFESPVALPTETAVWEESYTVVLNDGFYAVGLGDTADSHEALPLAKFPRDKERYLTINVDGEGDMAPRLRFGITPYAAAALEADTAVKALDLDCTACVGPSELSFDPTPANGSVTTEKLANGAVTETKLAADSVLSTHIANGEVGPGDLADLAVTEGKLGAGAVTAGKLGSAAVTTDKIADLNVTEAKLAAGAVSTDKLANTAVTGEKIAGNAIASSHIATGAIPWDRIESGLVPSARLPPNPVAGKTCQAGQAIQGFDSSGNPICVAAQPTPKLVERIGSYARRGVDGSLNDRGINQWYFVPGLAIPFFAVGGPVQVTLSLPMRDGSHASCRPLIDGVPAGVYTAADTTYAWQEGLHYTASVWRMWNNSRLYPSIVPGWHTLTAQCFNDSATDNPGLGNTSMTDVASVIPYDSPANSEVKAYTKTILGGQSIGCCSFGTVSGLSLQFAAQGGPVRIAISIPYSGGSHASCRPLIDGTPAGSGDIDDTGYGWQEGLNYPAGQWQMWNRTRIYTTPAVTAGNHTATVECRSDSGSLSAGNGDMSLMLGVVTYKPTNDPTATVRAYRAVSRGVWSLPASSNWVTLSGLSTTVPATGGPVEIGVSLPLTNGSSNACRPVLNGNALTSGEPDDFNYIWHDGIGYNGSAWQLWNRIRMYRNIPAGSYTLGVQCRGNSGTAQAGHDQMVSTVWAVVYDP